MTNAFKAVLRAVSLEIGSTYPQALKTHYNVNMSDLDGTNGWYEYKRLILTEITELKAAKKELQDCVHDLKLELEKMKQKLWLHILLTSSAAAGGAGALEFLLK